MRRRNLLTSSAKLTLSIDSIMIEPSASTFTFQTYYGGTQITSSTNLSITYDGTVISGYSFSNGNITANSTQYTATTTDRVGYIEASYNGENVRLNVMQKKDYVVGTEEKLKSTSERNISYPNKVNSIDLTNISWVSYSTNPPTLYDDNVRCSLWEHKEYDNYGNYYNYTTYASGVVKEDFSKTEFIKHYSGCCSYKDCKSNVKLSGLTSNTSFTISISGRTYIVNVDVTYQGNDVWGLPYGTLKFTCQNATATYRYEPGLGNLP